MELFRAQPKDSSLITRLLELYVYDFTEYMDFDVDEEGLFHYPFEDYFTKPHHWIYLMRVNEKIMGFAFVLERLDDQNKSCFTIQEFFILKKYRKMGIGQTIASMIFSLHPGSWLIYQSKNNIPAQVFWRKVIAACTQDRYQEYYQDDKPHQAFDISKTMVNPYVSS